MAAAEAIEQALSGGSTRGEGTYRRRRGRVIGLFALALAVLVAIGGLGLSGLETVMKDGLRGRISALRDAVAAGTMVWLEAQEHTATVVAGAPALHPLMVAVVRAEESTAGDIEAHTTALSALDEGQLFEGSALLAADGRVVMNHGAGVEVGVEAPPEVRRVYEAAVNGEARASLPFHVPEGEPRMVVGAPVMEGEELVAVILLGLSTDKFSATLLAARAGESGETYAVNRDGKLISDSRFLDGLREVRLIGPNDETAVLGVDVRDPGGDLEDGYTTGVLRSEQPLTRSAERALEGETGVDVDGYRDYRGTTVVGAWMRAERHGFAIITEVDAVEAYRPLVVLRRMFGGLLLLVLLAATATFAVGLLLERQRRRAGLAEKKAARLGQYQLEEKLGEGGMGAVYRAHHALLRRPTAVKLLHPTHNSAANLERFEREVRRTAELSHPNTISIYDYGHTADGVFYYAMEYLEGVDLDVLVERFGPMPSSRVIHLITQAAGALAEAHSVGMVHRDIKPANLFLCRRGGVPDTVKVLDFGLVKTSRPEDKTLTADDVVMGTPAYLPPEMVSSANAATPVSDIYALGAVAYYLVTGEPVFDGETAMALLMAHASVQPVPPSERLGAAVDATLEEVILACLEKSPAHRPQSADELIARLDAAEVAGQWTRAMAEDWWTRHQDSISGLTDADRKSVGTDETIMRIDSE